MRVLYVSKAMTVAAYRAKLSRLGELVELTAVLPERWGATEPEPGGDGGYVLRPLRTLFHGHNHLHLYAGLGPILDRTRPQLVHVDEEPYSAVTAQVVRLCRSRRVPGLFFAWQNLHKRLPPPFGTLRRYVFRNVRGGIAGTDRAASVLRRAGFRGAVAVIPQVGVDPHRFRPDPEARGRVRAALGLGEDDRVVGYGGRLVPEKGVTVLLAAVGALEGAHLLLVGEGPERRRLESAARKGGLRDRVHFAGHRPSGEVPGWLAACDAVALPSLGRSGWVEQFGRILVEAMACGVPVVGARSGEIPEVVGDAGLLVPPGDAPGLARALATLLEPGGEGAELGRRGRQRVLSRYTHDTIAGRTAAFYRDLVS